MLRRLAFTSMCLVLPATSSALHAAMITDFTTWTEVEDPAHPGMTSSVDSATQVTLNASGSIPAATDIGYASVDGADVGNSTAGYYFSINEDFHVAVDYAISSDASVGLAGIGLGIGEDAAGANSAGVGMGVFNGAPVLVTGASRTNDVTTAGAETYAGTASGRFFVAYEAASGTVTWGHSGGQGAVAPSNTGVFANIQDGWTDSALLVSFFLRSDTILTFPPLTSGELSAVFSNFEVLEGTPIEVPEPAGMALLCAGLMVAIRRRRH